MRVIGIDPAPVKGLQVFDGGDHKVALPDSRSFVQRLWEHDDVLICWDAPLTGPSTTVVQGGEAAGSAFSQRAIESFFSRAATGFKTPPGISVRGYSGCPHWALSRSLIGLPKTGPFDVADIPFKLAQDELPRPTRGRHVAEVHPAVALWLWCRNARDGADSWDYKKSPGVLMELWSLLLDIPDVAQVLAPVRHQPPTSDDEFDARIAYALGTLWLRDRDCVVLMGDAGRGMFLVPKSEELLEAFEAFNP